MPEKKGFLGCSFPLVIIIGIVLVALVTFGLIGGALGREIFGDLGLDFLNVPQPHPELPPEVVFHIFGFPVTNSMVGAWVTIVFLLAFSWAVTRRIRLIPGRFQSAFEFMLGSLYDFCKSVAGESNGRRFFPLVATIFLFVAFNAWLSLIPGFGSIEILNPEGQHVHLFRGPNTDINLPLALALVSFTAVLFFGLKTAGFRYLQQYFNFQQFFKGCGQLLRGQVKAGLSGVLLGVIDLFVGGLELLSHLIRIVSLTLRLFGNMTAGEILLLVIAFLVPWAVGTIFYGLELLVGFLQALIFAGLTLVFLTMATAGHGEESH
ncbi:F0F1 ATP synthase subunit A [Chloroflexota bacterium]